MKPISIMMNKKNNTASTLTDPPVGGTIQVGTIVAYYGKTAPETWLVCDGAAIPAKYNDLITLIGANTPNLCARVLIGEGEGTDTNGITFNVGIGDTGGEFTHELKLTEIPSHQHFGFGESNDGNWGTGRSSSKGYTGTGDNDTDNYLYGSTFTGGTPGDTIATNNGSVTGKSAGATTPHNNMQPYLGVLYIIYAGTK